MGVTGIKLQGGETLPLDGVFVAIGSSPYTKIVDSMNADKDSDGCLIVDKRQETSVK
jgi:thioredoxin reductase